MWSSEGLGGGTDCLPEFKLDRFDLLDRDGFTELSHFILILGLFLFL